MNKTLTPEEQNLIKDRLCSRCRHHGILRGPVRGSWLRQNRGSACMKRMYAYHEAHPTSGFVVECETDGRWTCSFRHEGDFDSLYNECERRAKVNEARLEAVIQGLPKEPAQRQRPAAIPVV